MRKNEDINVPFSQDHPRLRVQGWWLCGPTEALAANPGAHRSLRLVQHRCWTEHFQIPAFRWQARLWKRGRWKRHEHVAMWQFRPKRKTPLAVVALIRLLCVFLGCQTIPHSSTSGGTLATCLLYPNLLSSGGSLDSLFSLFPSQSSWASELSLCLWNKH